VALSFSEVKKGVVGDLKYSITNVTFDSSYPTGGEAVTVADFGFTHDILHLNCAPGGGIVFEFDDTNTKILAFWGDNNNAADGPLVEVPNTTDLSTKVTRVFALGK
jgi:hypothetical protein